MRVRWHFGLGPDLGLAFWALTAFEAAYGAYMSIWPLWIERLGAPIAIVGLVLGSAGVIRPLVIGPGSSLTDRFDTRRLLLVARSLNVAGMVVAALAQSWPLLFITVVTGTIGELVFPAIHTYVSDHAGTDAVRAFTMVITVGPSVALVVTPLVSGLLIAIAGMRAAFLLSAFLTLMGMLVVSCMSFRRDPRETAEGRTGSYRQAWRHDGIRNIVLSHGCTVISLAIGASLIPNFLEDERGYDPALVSALSAAAAIGTIGFGIVTSRTPALRRLPVLAAAIAAGGSATGYLLFATQSLLPVIGLAFLLRGGLFSAWTLYLAAMGSVAPNHLRPRAFAIVEMVGGSAISFGPVIAAQLWRVDPRAPLITAAVLTGATIVWILSKGVDHVARGLPEPEPVPEHEGFG